MSPVQIETIGKIPASHLPGQIYHRGMPHFVDPADLLLLNQDQLLKSMMRKSGGMSGDRSQTPGVFARIISYAHMPVNDMQDAVRYWAEENARNKESDKGREELIALGMRPAESIIDNWIRGSGGSPPDDIPPVLKQEYLYEKALWRAREGKSLLALQNPSGEVQEWMDKLHLRFGMLQEALVNPFQIDSNSYVESELLLRMRDLGLLGLKVPEEYGGLGLSQREYDRVLRRLIRTTLSGTLAGIISAHSTIGSAPLVKYGTEAQKEYYLREIAKGLYLCAFGLTERGSGTDAIDGAGAVAKKVDNNWVLNGSKIFITNTHRSGVMFVLAKIDDGSGEPKPTVFIVDLPFRITDSKDLMNAKRKILAKGDLGELSDDERRALEEANLSEGEKRALNQEGKIIISNPLDLMMIKGSNQAYIEFHDFKLPEVKEIDGHKVESILGGKEGIGQGAKQIFNSLNAGRAGFGSFCAEASSGALELALVEAVQRPRFPLYGGRLADLPVIKEYISKMAVKVAALNATTELTTALIDKYPNMNIIAEAAAIKAFATEEAWEIIPTVARIFGGMGTMKGNAVELMLRDMWIPLIVEGVNEALKQHMILVSSKPAMRAQKALKFDMDGIREAWKVLKGRVHYEKGDLNFGDAFWVQRQTKRLSRKALILGMLNGNKTALEQKKILQIADRAIELYAITAVLLKLQQIGEPKTLREKAEKAALEQYVENVQSRKEEYPDYIADLLIEDTKLKVGEQRAENDELVKRQLTSSTAAPQRADTPAKTVLTP